MRNAARMAAGVRLRRLYPGEFLAAYSAELRLRGLEEVRQHYQVPVWEDIIVRLVKAATGRDEASLASAVRQGRAVQTEAEILRMVSRLRALLSGDGMEGLQVTCPDCGQISKRKAW